MGPDHSEDQEVECAEIGYNIEIPFKFSFQVLVIDLVGGGCRVVWEMLGVDGLRSKGLNVCCFDRHLVKTSAEMWLIENNVKSLPENGSESSNAGRDVN